VRSQYSKEINKQIDVLGDSAIRQQNLLSRLNCKSPNSTSHTHLLTINIKINLKTG